MLYMISVVFRMTPIGETVQFNILDTAINKVETIEYSTLMNKIDSGRIYVENLRMDSSREVLEGWNGSIKRYTRYDRYNKRINELALIILARKNGVYTVSSPTGEVKTVTEEKLINALNNSKWTIANGKIVYRNNKYSIVPIQGGYPSSLDNRDSKKMQGRLQKREKLASDRINRFESKCNMVGKEHQKLEVKRDKIIQNKFKMVLDECGTLHIFIEKLTEIALISEKDIMVMNSSEVMIHSRGNALEYLRIMNSDIRPRATYINVMLDIPESRITSMDKMFSQCTSIETIDLTGFKPYKLRSLKYTFEYCTNLLQIELGNLDTSLVEDYNGCFTSCSKLGGINLKTIDTSSAIDLSEMFLLCKRLQAIDISHFDTSNVRDFSYMFAHCGLLKVIDLSNIMIHPSAKIDKMLQKFNGDLIAPKDAITGRVLKHFIEEAK